MKRERGLAFFSSRMVDFRVDKRVILGGTRTKYLEIIGIISRKWLLGLELNRDFGFSGLVENQFLGINMTGNSL